ncbi:RHS repeat-associated core domain-containing protein [Pseudomonas sp. WJP1]|uniref:RHS repeat-associated core domain-containing protein n=1 Tax=Pseudomonas sp. WJP1 TaxID=2986947 RepID=UPI00300E3FF8
MTELQGQASQSVFQHDKQLLALQSRQGDELRRQLLATDQQRSVLQLVDSGGAVHQVYAPYGHRHADTGLGSLLGYNGEALDPVTGHYLLGNGHRAFNPVLMRFNSPDRLSPFGRGGLNPYAYCLGDPVNFRDPTGQFAAIARILTSIGGLFNSVISLRPGISFQVALDALANGAVFRLPLRHSVGAVSAVTAGITGVVSAAVGVASTVIAAVNPASSLLAPAANATLGLAGSSAAGRLGSWWAARNPSVLEDLKKLADGSPVAVSPVTSAASRRSSFSAIEMDSFTPSAPPPDTPQPSAPPRTPGHTSIEMFSFNQSTRPNNASASGTEIRRRFSR